MKRFMLAALVLSVVAVAAYPASKSKANKPAKSQAAKAAASTPVPLASLFPSPAPDSQAVTTSNGMVMMDAPNHEVVMVRVDSDGNRAHACVNTESSARAFLSGAKASASTTSSKKGE